MNSASSEQSRFPELTGFLFGNLDEHGNLESDFLDEESRSSLANLGSFLGGSLSEDILRPSLGNDESSSAQSSVVTPQAGDDGTDGALEGFRSPRSNATPDSPAESKASSAADFFDFDEVIEPEELNTTDLEDQCTSAILALLRANEDSDNEEDEPVDYMPVFDAGNEADDEEDGTGEEELCSPMGTSLARLLPPEYKNIDIRKLFPEFRRGRVLRFCRLFGLIKDSSAPQLYRSAKSSKARRKSIAMVRSASGGHPADEVVQSLTAAMDLPSTSTAGLPDDGPCDVKVEGAIPSPGAVPSPGGAPEAAEETHENSDIAIVKSESEKPLTLDLSRADDVEFMLDFAPTPPPDQCATDDEMLQLKPEDPSTVKKRQNARTHSTDADLMENVAPWRYGPAAYWYDLMGVSETGEEFDYGFKLKKKPDQAASSEQDVPSTEPSTSTEESQLMVNQVRWEDKIIWNGDEAREELRRTLGAGKQPICGWIPTQQTRTYEQFMATLKSGGFSQILGGSAASRSTAPSAGSLATSNMSVDPILSEGQEPDSYFCILPPDNMDFINKRWEDDIIWDAEAMDRIPEPLTLTLDATDPHTILNLPDDKAANDESSVVEAVSDESPTKSSGDGARKDHQFTKKSQMIAGRVASRQEEDDDEETGQSSGHMIDKDLFNISNDEYYLPRSSASLAAIRGGFIQHSIPAQNLMSCFFPTELKVSHLRHFHRPPLRLQKGSVTGPGNVSGVMSLSRHISIVQKQRDQERKALGGGELFFMRTPGDLSARDGMLIYLEYSEEHPPLLSQPGMASKVRNYHKRLSGKDSSEPKFQFGETAFTHTSPFLGALSPGESLQAIENNLFRTPIYQHQCPSTDFLVIRSNSRYFIRHVPAIFCVGQECPLYEVPGPNSKRATNFVRDFLLVYIYRLFWSSVEEPKRLRMEDVRRAFPQYAESSIRKRLKMCANFTRIGTGVEACFWVLRDDFRLPSQEELRAMVSPEMCCGYYSMVAAEQRLKDAGYGEKYFFTPEDEEEDQPVKIEDEVKCAPWNTTRAFIGAMKGKCLLDLTGPADPTGCGEGFSYIRESVKPPKTQNEQSEKMKQQMKRTVTGTDADLRKLSLKDAKALLKKFGITDEEIKTLTRWEIIDVIRTLSTQQARMGGAGITKFARGSMRFSLAEIQQRFKTECQRIFDLQNKVLACSEPLSSDDESSADDSDLDEMGKNIENMLSSKKQIDVSFDAEEEERLELQKLLHGDTAGSKKGSKGGKEAPAADESDPLADLGTGSLKWRKLKIYRTFRNENGGEYVAEETVTRPEVIDAYVRVRMKKDESFIRHFVQSSAEYKEEKRKEKRRLQDRLRRIRRNEELFKEGIPIGRAPRRLNPNKKPPPPKPQLKMKCSACGKVGHMKTNKECAMYNMYTPTSLPPTQVAKTDEQIEAELAKDLPADKRLVSVEGTKVKLSRTILEHANRVRRNALVLKFPKKALKTSDPEPIERKPKLQVSSIPPAASTMQSTVIAPVSTVQSPNVPGIFVPQPVVMALPMRPTITPMLPLNPLRFQAATALKRFPKMPAEYPSVQYRKTRFPMSSALIRKPKPLSANYASLKLKLKRGPVGLNRPTNVLAARRKAQPVKPPVPSLDYLKRPVPQQQTHLVERRRADPKVSISSVFEGIINELKEMGHHVEPFLTPVNRKDAPKYYDIVSRPMDLLRLKENVMNHKYLTREEFLKDLQLIVENSALYNGVEDRITDSARLLLEHAARKIEEKENQLMRLEKAINPLLDDDEKAFAHVFLGIIEKLKAIPKSYAFHNPVDKRKVKQYYEKIKHPMDLGTMEAKIKKTPYQNVQEFLYDVELIYSNSVEFNGTPEKSQYTAKAKEIFETTKRLIDENRNQLMMLERNIRQSKAKALQAMEEDHARMTEDHHGRDPFEMRPEDMDDTEDQAHFHSQISPHMGESCFGLAGDDDDDDDDVMIISTTASGMPLPPKKKARIDRRSWAAPTADREDSEGGHGESDSGYPAKSISGTTSTSGLRRSLSHEGLASIAERSRTISECSKGDGSLEHDELEPNQMELDGQLHADLAMSDSDDEPGSSERVRVLTAEDEDAYDFSLI